MNQLSSTELFESTLSSFKIIEDSELIKQAHFVLQEAYFFSLNANNKKYPFYQRHHCINDAVLMKMDDYYYIATILYNDEYRDCRSDIYQLNMDSTFLQPLLFQKNIVNVIPFPIDVNIEEDKTGNNSGIIVCLDNYVVKERAKHLIALSTDNADDYYPRGIIHFHQTLLINAKPLIEKNSLDRQLKIVQTSHHKIKI